MTGQLPTDGAAGLPGPTIIRYPWALRQIAFSALLVAMTLIGPPILALLTRPDQPRESVVALTLGVAGLAWLGRRAARARLQVTDAVLRGDATAVPLADLVEVYWQTSHHAGRSAGAGGGGSPNDAHRLRARTTGADVQLCRHVATDDAALRFTERLRHAGLPVTPLTPRA